MRYLIQIFIVLYLFLLSCSEKPTSFKLSNENEIKSFSIERYSLVGKIDNINKTVRIKITPDIGLTNLTPTIQISPWATINPSSGEEQNFTDTIKYTVTAENGSIAIYNTYTDIGNYIINPCLLIVHMQNYFINLLQIHNRTTVVSTISNILSRAREESIPVIFSKSLPPNNREIINELNPIAGELVIESSNDLPVIDAIDNLHIKNVVVVGVLTHACVKDVCIELHNAGYNVFLVRDATSVLLGQDINLIENTCNELEEDSIAQTILSSEIIL